MHRRLLVTMLLVSACSSKAPRHVDEVGPYVAKVNALCDALLVKVEPYNHPGAYPVATFTAETAGHRALLVGFDADVAQLHAPAAAAAQHKALQDYVRLADQIDHRREVAASQGQTAFDKANAAIAQEFPNDPVHAALLAAGFSESCTAR